MQLHRLTLTALKTYAGKKAASLNCLSPITRFGRPSSATTTGIPLHRHLAHSASAKDYSKIVTLHPEMAPSYAPKGPPRLSASLILLSPTQGTTPDGFDYKVCLLERGSGISNASATVFPGGNIDKVDHIAAKQYSLASTSASSSMSDIPMEALKVCAIRETFEEVGVLLSDPPGSSLSQNQAPTELEYRTWRKQLSQDSSSLLNIYSRLSSQDRKVRPPVEQLVEWSRWITPVTQPKRFDTMFFLHILPQASVDSPNPLLRADGTETASAEWITPHHALDLCLKEKKTILFPPQVYLLAELAAMPTLDQVRKCAQARRALTILPKAKAVGNGKTDLAFVYPGDAEYEDENPPNSESGQRHRTYAEAVYKNGKAHKPKQPLTVKGVVRLGIAGFPNIRIGTIPEFEIGSQKAKL